jgi:hypothetical protein
MPEVSIVLLFVVTKISKQLLFFTLKIPFNGMAPYRNTNNIYATNGVANDTPLLYM